MLNRLLRLINDVGELLLAMVNGLLRFAHDVWELMPAIVWLSVLAGAAGLLLLVAAASVWDAWCAHVERQAEAARIEQARLNARLEAAHGLTDRIAEIRPRRPGEHAQPWKGQRRGGPQNAA